MFQAVLPIRPVSTQKKGSKVKYKEKILRLVQSKNYIKKSFVCVRLYARILWLHSINRETDVDNIIKPILDSLNEQVYKDDYLITTCAVKAMKIHEFTLSSKFLKGQIYQDFVDLLSSSHKHILYIEVDNLIYEKPFFGPIDGNINE